MALKVALPSRSNLPLVQLHREHAYAAYSPVAVLIAPSALARHRNVHPEGVMVRERGLDDDAADLADDPTVESPIVV